MKQTSRIISTYSADTMGVCSALFELGGMTIMHDASGCNSTYTTHDEPRWYDMDSMVYISALTEMDAVMGNDEKLLQDIEEAAALYHPKFVAIAGTPIPTMTGFDFESVARLAEQRTALPCMGFSTTGMNTYVHGASMAFAELARRFVKEPAAGSAENSMKLRVNILGLTPLDFSINGQDKSIKRWLESEGFEVLSSWAMGSTLEEIERSAEADLNLVVSAAGFGAARVLFERFGMPYAVGLPIGEDLSGLLADQMKIRTEEFRKEDALASRAYDLPSFESREISVHSGIFEGSGGSGIESGFAAVIGEGVRSLSLASAIELECGIPSRVLCTTECPDDMLRECDAMTPDEEDIIAYAGGARIVIADPLYEPVCPQDARFIPLPSEAFSGRIYRDGIPDLIDNFRDFSRKIEI